MSQQKTNAQKVFSETKIFTNFKKSKKMKNLKNLNLVELNAQEVKSIDGGIAPALVIGIGWGIMTGLSIVGVAIADKYNVKLFNQ